MSVKLLTDCHLEFLSLKGGCTGLAKLAKCHIVRNHMSWLIFMVNLYVMSDLSIFRIS